MYNFKKVKKIMKKIMMTLAAVCVAATMNAQVYVGGTLGLGFQNKLTDKDGKDATGMTFAIKPEIGYVLNENSALGIVLGFGVSNNSNMVGEQYAAAANTNLKLDKSAVTFTVSPYYRYNYLKFSNVNLFFDGQFAFGLAKQDNNKLTQIGLGIVPGVSVNLNEKISFVAKMGFIGWTSTKAKINGVEGDAQSTFGLGVNSLSGLEFGMYYNF